MADDTEPRSIVDFSADVPIRILHLSDFHLSRKRQWDQRRVLRGLADAVGEMTKAGLAPDVVAITGDLAARGSVEDYQQVQRWIDEGLGKALPSKSGCASRSLNQLRLTRHARWQFILLKGQLQPVLRAADFQRFDLDRTFRTVQTIAERL